MIWWLVQIGATLAMSGAASALQRFLQTTESNAMGALSFPPPPRRGAPLVDRDASKDAWKLALIIGGAILGSAAGLYLGWVITEILPDAPRYATGGWF
jgi:hypothetical protein